ncbi:TPA: SLATT domain-containing protein [Stenotrophomonas maltophilia]|nr:SLATT domain-containing protein [Stenotrophomonas maltophilia]
MVAIASGALAYLQSKRYSELAASYALTAHEIGVVEEQLAQVKGEREFSLFVGDAENAFSREHTQWEARKDI